jgi:hypothetical protein
VLNQTAEHAPLGIRAVGAPGAVFYLEGADFCEVFLPVLALEGHPLVDRGEGVLNAGPERDAFPEEHVELALADIRLAEHVLHGEQLDLALVLQQPDQQLDNLVSPNRREVLEPSQPRPLLRHDHDRVLAVDRHRPGRRLGGGTQVSHWVQVRVCYCRHCQQLFQPLRLQHLLYQLLGFLLLLVHCLSYLV